ncbi:small multi-drug export protein [Evansella halocellulosilytica]|uniref:small multi-drug export protein n=1 Tax=Evansella halocellulosilytica TaxID=2011013 RepID=UPI000BB691DD|nr:small multi-drug export protein [Evansella halocellulosilytica]
MWEVLWQYIVIFIMAATPWLEILFVIPVGIAIGLNPIFVAIVSFIGNYLPIILIIYAFKWLKQRRFIQKWKQRRDEKKEKRKTDQQLDATEEKVHEKESKQRKKQRAAAIFHKYGIPGLAIVGPILTGIHLAAIIALSLNANKNTTAVWMAISLAAWTIVITAASYYGIEWITNIL